MPRKHFALIKGDSKEIEVSWGFTWKHFTVKQNEEIIGTIENQKELRKGKQFTLKDGSILFMKLKVGFIQSGLEITRNGLPLPGSDMDPFQKIKIVFGLLLFISIIDLALGISIAALGSRMPGLAIGIAYIILGLVFLGLAFGSKKHSLVLLYVAMVLLFLDAMGALVFQAITENTIVISWAVIRLIFLVFLLYAIKPMKEIKKQKLFLK